MKKLARTIWVIFLCAVCFYAGASLGRDEVPDTVQMYVAQSASSAPLAQAVVSSSPTPTKTPRPTPKYTPKPTPQYTSRLRATPTVKPTRTPAASLVQAARGAVQSAASPRATRTTRITGWVIGDSANVRKGASTDYQVVEKLYYGEKIYVIDASARNGWYKVETESGATGYISGKLISSEKPQARSVRNNSGSSSAGSGSRNSGGSSVSSSQPQGRTVYVSRTGECYHSYAGCSDMINPIVMTEDEAIARGRRRCRKCW